MPALAALVLYMWGRAPQAPSHTLFKHLTQEVVELQLEPPSPTRRQRPQDPVGSNA